jgi:two-component system chemotaxis response regulator CheB
MFPANFHLPIFIVQHMPAEFTKLLAERLNTLTELNVVEASDGAPVQPASVYLAPGGYHMELAKKGGAVSILLTQAPAEHSCRPSVDVLFRSAAEVYGAAAIAAVLTGMGNDGAEGALAMHSRGAYIIAQDQASSVVWGMPSRVVSTGAADAVVDLREVVPEILRNI